MKNQRGLKVGVELAQLSAPLFLVLLNHEGKEIEVADMALLRQ
jgi:hypothetical protein